MSQRKSPTDQLADDIGCMIIGILWVAAVGLFTLLFKTTQVAPEDQLLKLQPGFAWWWRIEPQDCPDCGAVNESYKRSCYQCGATLATPTEAATPSTGQTTPNRQMAFWLIVLGLIIFYVLLGLIMNAR